MKFNGKVIGDLSKLSMFVKAHQALGKKVVCTIGSWDILHVGHLRYLTLAAEHGDVLVVGVDSDRTVKLYKGPLRPIIPQDERIEMLSYQGCIDYIVLVDDVDEKGAWQYELIKKVQFDVFVVEGSSYTEQQQEVIKSCCGELVVLTRQAEKTSSTGIIQLVLKANKNRILETIEKALETGV